MPHYRAYIEVRIEVESSDQHEAREDVAVKLIHMIRQDEIAINLWPIPTPAGDSR